MNETQWLPGIFALAVALAGAGLYLLFARRPEAGQTDATSSGPDGRAPNAATQELERQAQLALDAVRSHREAKHLQAPEAWEAELKRLELAAAAALKARDEGAAAASAQPAAPPGRQPVATTGVLGVFDRHPALKVAVWGSGVVLFFIALGLVLGQESQERKDGMEATGTVPPMGVPTGVEHDHDGDGVPDHANHDDPPQLAAALERFRRNPLDLDAAGESSHILIQLQRTDEADVIVQRALAVDPFAAELRVHRAVIQALRGDTGSARKELQLLIDLYPGSEEALLFLGSLAMMEGREAEGLEHFEHFAIDVPRTMQPSELLPAIAELRMSIRGADVPPKN
ncbi:MAG TPA: hypothetical protein VK013_08670 [Myxococcaceae bacterium]|nr:hypothetical protein [Myxococcaceae bacterium]